MMFAFYKKKTHTQSAGRKKLDWDKMSPVCKGPQACAQAKETRSDNSLLTIFSTNGRGHVLWAPREWNWSERLAPAAVVWQTTKAELTI